MNPAVLANVIRGDTVESIHRGHLVVLDGGGKTIFSLGDPSTVTYFRSSAKAFQAIPFLTSGAADAFGFTDEEIALTVASHSGEQRHVAIAAGMLTKIGLSESDLRCGAHQPFDEAESHRMLAAGEKPTQLHNNCSGKHASMLAFAKHIGSDIATYDLREHRIQQRILRCVSDFTEIPAIEIAIGIDGCAAPNFALPVSAMAKSFVNLLSPTKFPEATQKACSRVVSAMLKFPELIGGSTRLDTMLMRVGPNKFISKVGADGVWLCGVLPSDQWPHGLGIALKIEDGDDYLSRPSVTVDLLRQLALIDNDALPELSPLPVRNRRGDVVGRIESVVKIAGVRASS